MGTSQTSSPSWDQLFDIAAAQSGHFTTQQAAEAGYSPQLLAHHLGNGKILRVRRGIYRLTHYPADEHEDLVVIWLWSEQQGVFSHQTALSLHQLSDALPAGIELTLPANWRKRRLRTPTGVTTYYADIKPKEREWFGPVPVTSSARTLRDCALADLSPELLRQATHDALERGLVSKTELGEVLSVLEPFGGLKP